MQRHGRRDLYVETWGLTIDRELPSNFLASAQYLGSRGVRLFSRGGVNFCSTRRRELTRPATPSALGRSTNTIRAGDPYGSVDYKSDIGSSTYNALLLSLERRFSNGLSFQSRYTWSHSINDGSVGGGESNGPENVNCLACDKGPSVFDVRNNFTVNAVYELPFGPGKPFMNEGGVLGKIVGGWQLGSIGIWHTGHPLTITMNISPCPVAGRERSNHAKARPCSGGPDISPGGRAGSHPSHQSRRFRSSAARSLRCRRRQRELRRYLWPRSRFGDAPTGCIRALNSWQIDLALTKETKLTERVSMKFGAQVFNIFNHTQYGDPNPNNLSFQLHPGDGQNRNPIPNDWILQPAGSLGLIDTTVNFNNNNDNAARPIPGPACPGRFNSCFASSSKKRKVSRISPEGPGLSGESCRRALYLRPDSGRLKLI